MRDENNFTKYAAFPSLEYNLRGAVSRNKIRESKCHLEEYIS